MTEGPKTSRGDILLERVRSRTCRQNRCSVPCVWVKRPWACPRKLERPAGMKRMSEHVARERGLLVMGNTLERYKKLRRGSAACSQRNSWTAVRIHCRSKTLKAIKGRGSTTHFRGVRSSVPCPSNVVCCLRRSSLRRLRRERQEGIPRRRAWEPDSEGKPLESENPMGVTGTKQGRTSGRGESRREGEKPWGRNVSGVANRSKVDSLGLKRRRGEKLHESCWFV